MNYSELMALSKVGISADGICCYRVSPVEREDADVMVVGVRAMDAVQDAWVDSLPNSRRVCLSWVPSSPQEQSVMFDAFVDGEIEKGFELWRSGDYTLEHRPRGIVVSNRKTGTNCYCAHGDTSNMCFQGQRCGTCKHYCLLVIAGFIEDAPMLECYQKYLISKGLETWAFMPS